MPRTLPFLACLLLSLGAAANAQNTTAPANVVVPTPTPREGTVGPEQLRDFSLPGTRTPAPATNDNPAPARTTTTPTTTAPPATRPAPAERPAATTTDTARAPAPATVRAVEPTAPATLERTAPTSSTSPAPVSDSLGGAPSTTTLPSTELGLPPASLPVTSPPISPAVPATSASNWWAWLLAAALAGVAIALFLRRRGRRSYAGGFDEPSRPFAEPMPEPPTPVPAARPLERAAPQPAPQPAPATAPAPNPTGIVSTRLRAAPAAPAPAATEPAAPLGAVVSSRLRAWIDLDLAMREILIDSTEAILRFDLAIINGGAAAAREVVVEAIALNAGEGQGEAIERFFAQRTGSNEGIAEMAPMGSAMVSHEIRLPRSAILAYEAGGRTLFVPIIAFNASYRAGSTTGRTSAAFLLGRDVPGSDRLAPLLLGEGNSRLLGLGVRRLDEMVRR